MDTARVDLAAAHRLAVMEDFHEGTWGHFSLAVDGPDDPVLITTPEVHWSQIKASELVQVSRRDEERLAQERGSLWVSYRIHYPVHEARPDARCVLHAHPRNATALSTLQDWRLEMVEQNALMFAGEVAYCDEYDGAWPTDMTQGRKIAEQLGPEKSVLVLRNHGVVVTAPTVAEAWTRLYLFERACGTQLLAMSTGRPFAPVDMTVAEDYEEETGFEQGHFDGLKRLLDETQPSYKE
jgi:ribulose-5-phosphate 4-epimerase/fuculose-1-phosphate aldolase